MYKCMHLTVSTVLNSTPSDICTDTTYQRQRSPPLPLTSSDIAASASNSFVIEHKRVVLKSSCSLTKAMKVHFNSSLGIYQVLQMSFNNCIFTPNSFTDIL